MDLSPQMTQEVSLESVSLEGFCFLAFLSPSALAHAWSRDAAPGADVGSQDQTSGVRRRGQWGDPAGLGSPPGPAL